MKPSAYPICLLGVALSACATFSPSDPSTKTHRLETGSHTLKIDVSAGFSLSSHDGMDFSWFGFADENTNSFLGIYQGYHPQFNGTKDAEAPRHAGRIGKVPVVWFTWSTNGLYGSETLVRGFFGKRSQGESMEELIHISVTSTNESGVERLEKAAATLRR